MLHVSRLPHTSVEAKNRFKYANPRGDVLMNCNIVLRFIQIQNSKINAGAWCRQRLLSLPSLQNSLQIAVQLIQLLQKNSLLPHSSLPLTRSPRERRLQETQQRSRAKRRRYEILPISHNDAVRRDADFSAVIDETPAVEGGELEVAGEEEEGICLVNGRELGRFLEHMSGQKMDDFLTEEKELFLGFLCGCVNYPNYAISNKSWGFFACFEKKRNPRESRVDVSMSCGNRGRRRVSASDEVELAGNRNLAEFCTIMRTMSIIPSNSRYRMLFCCTKKCRFLSRLEVDFGHKKGLFGERDRFAASSDIASVGRVPAGEAFHA